MLTMREQSVLEAVVREYVTSAVPVSSHTIAKKAVNDVSSATIRSIMMDLEDAGYLTQPHASAGRYPTQEGYRYFVDACAVHDALPRSLHARIASLLDRNDALRFATMRTHLFAVAVDETGVSYAYGLGEVLQEPEFSDTVRLRMFGKLVDMVSMMPDHYRDRMHIGDDPVVFIEHENPVPEAHMLSVVAAPTQDTGMLFVIGPSRMDYGRVVALMRALTLVC